MGKMRVTSHNGRWCRGEAYSTKHNDRKFDVAEPHINKDKTSQNLYWNCFDGFNKWKNDKGQDVVNLAFMPFDDVEKNFMKKILMNFCKTEIQNI